MVDRYVVRARIAKIRQYVALLKRIRGLTNEATFVKDPLIYGNAERYLQLSIHAWERNQQHPEYSQVVLLGDREETRVNWGLRD